MLSFIYRVDEPFKDSLQSSQWNDKYLFFLKKYSDDGNLEATLELGRAYQYGSCIGINNKKAVALITKAAEGGLDEAQFHLQGLYRYGWAGLAKDYEKVSYWLDKAAAQEHLEALYQKGLDLLVLDSNRSKGINYIKRSADLGFWVAIEYLDSFRK
ncbi:hypothetical protein MTZ49_01445 [Entomomonas sp. E2T0]|uniref:tetratricopeptide repeat protein n=1 Tax=Entomomonas sp. E2T0 TaxID=2930213 RepID=UPI0022283635|nr:hypothetical protein [Entomomonas sp. E2T0]UYZ84272.1 hypothetical protein MTZ49_01445 [Entomomonas sp. E2T0]